MSVVAAARGQGLRPSSSSNVLVNSRFQQDNSPEWTDINGRYGPADLFRASGDYTPLPSWGHYSAIYNSYGTYVGLNMLLASAPYTQAPYRSGYTDRIIKLFGIQDYRATNAANITNANPIRGSNQTGIFTSDSQTRMVGNTEPTVTVSSSTALDSTDVWARTTENGQAIDIPDSATSVKFGAQIRIPEGDRLRPLNFAGIYCTEDRVESTVNVRYVNYFAIRHTDATFTLPTGTATGGNREYNWSGLSTDTRVDSQANLRYKFYAPETSTITEHAMLDQNDYSEFTKVEYTFTPQTGTGRKMMLNLFFAESLSYLDEQSTTVNTGGFQVYDPFVEFT